MQLEFCPGNQTYWTPTGAVRSGVGVDLFVGAEGVTACSLLLRKDGESYAEEMQMEQVSHGFSLHLDRNEPGLFFFSFLASEGAERCRFGRHPNGQTVQEGNEWPLLFYDRDFSVPEWTKGAVMYQIFPDRFAREGEVRTDGVKNRRTIHKSTGERPLFTMDEPDYQATDFYGGNLKGVISRLPYLSSLGVTLLYFNPIFEAASNHRYNTADYLTIDPMLGTNEDFSTLCERAHALGMRVMLDGVFSHTGSDSRYFNKEGHYPSLGAYQSADSPYASWYSFGETREDYACWWNFKTLPNVNELDPSYLSFICGEDGVLRHWLRMGADGWRLDVADELPDGFLEAVRKAIKAEKSDALLIGEVWEDAALKYSYGARRKFLQGRQLDSVMNYPFRSGIIDCILQNNAFCLASAVQNELEHYPAPALFGLMNMLSTHDTWRILQVLGTNRPISKEQEPDDRLTPEEYACGEHRLKRAALLQYFLPGIPSIYYGDEAGMAGCGDPWNRRCFPWERAFGPLPDFFRSLGVFRNRYRAFFGGAFSIAAKGAEQLTMRWEKEGKQLILIANFGGESLLLPAAKERVFTLGAVQPSEDGQLLSPDSMAVLLA